MKAWKAFEVECADFFGGKRRTRIDYSERIGDIIHPHFSIECKWGKQIPKYLNVDNPTMLRTQRGVYALIPSEDCVVDMDWVYTHEQYEDKERKHAKFLDDAIRQARGYSAKEPIVCVKPKGKHGFIICKLQMRIWTEEEL